MESSQSFPPALGSVAAEPGASNPVTNPATFLAENLLRYELFRARVRLVNINQLLSHLDVVVTLMAIWYYLCPGIVKPFLTF